MRVPAPRRPPSSSSAYRTARRPRISGVRRAQGRTSASSTLLHSEFAGQSSRLEQGLVTRHSLRSRPPSRSGCLGPRRRSTIRSARWSRTIEHRIAARRDDEAEERESGARRSGERGSVHVASLHATRTPQSVVNFIDRRSGATRLGDFVHDAPPGAGVELSLRGPRSRAGDGRATCHSSQHAGASPWPRLRRGPFGREGRTARTPLGWPWVAPTREVAIPDNRWLFVGRGRVERLALRPGIYRALRPPDASRPERGLDVPIARFSQRGERAPGTEATDIEEASRVGAPTLEEDHVGRERVAGRGGAAHRAARRTRATRSASIGSSCSTTSGRRPIRRSHPRSSGTARVGPLRARRRRRRLTGGSRRACAITS